MKDWRTYAIIILALWCIWLTNRRYHDRLVAREMAMCAGNDALGGWDRERMEKATQAVFEETFVCAEKEAEHWAEAERQENERIKERMKNGGIRSRPAAFAPAPKSQDAR